MIFKKRHVPCNVVSQNSIRTQLKLKITLIYNTTHFYINATPPPRIDEFKTKKKNPSISKGELHCKFNSRVNLRTFVVKIITKTIMVEIWLRANEFRVEWILKKKSKYFLSRPVSLQKSYNNVCGVFCAERFLSCHTHTHDISNLTTFFFFTLSKYLPSIFRWSTLFTL